MYANTPHFLLFSEAHSEKTSGHRRRDDDAVGQWRFVLESIDGESRLEATDEELANDANRLELLAVVRGLEALDQPSRVTLVTPSRYVTRGLRFGLNQWRENDWQWERFGEMTPVKNSDLWRRVDGAMRYHDVECRIWRFDPPQQAARGVRSPVAKQQPPAPKRRRKSSAPTAKTNKPTERPGMLSACGRMLRGVVGSGKFKPRGKLETQSV
jgi:ribonuclease HI